jgi:mannitol/fructose-specific phosphotransferase system IIA component (Ntr-type)
LETLSEIAEMLSDPDLRLKMAESPAAQDLHQLIAQWQSAQVPH